MSLPWSDLVRVALAPDEMAFVRHGRGLRHRPMARGVKPCPAAEGDPAWRGAIECLRESLTELAPRPAEVSVVLSNHFVRFAIVPWRPDIVQRDERKAFARHCLREIYGDVVDGWHVRESPAEYGKATVACAIDDAFCQALTAVFAEAKVRLVSVQPLLMAAFNEFRLSVGTNGAFVIYEKGRLCTVSFSDGHWCTVHASRMPIEVGWQTAVERELALRAGADDEPVFVCVVEDRVATRNVARMSRVARHPGPSGRTYAVATLGETP